MAADYRQAMPRISAFYGVVHGKVLAGSLEPRALQFVREWADLRQVEILADWERARKNEPLLQIPPLP